MYDVFRLREVSDVAKTQVFALEARQQSREKEVECLRRQVLDYQVREELVRENGLRKDSFEMML